jgi:hypothetical protein
VNSPQVEAQITAIEKKVVNELGLLPVTTDPYFMKVWNHLLADEILLAELTTQTLESAAVKAALVLQLAAEKRESDLRTKLTRAIKVLETTAGNIRSLRAAGNCTTYDRWLEVVEAELPAVRACPSTEVSRG